MGRGSLRTHHHAEDPAVFTWHPNFSRRNVENMGLHHVHPQKAPTDGENGFKTYVAGYLFVFYVIDELTIYLGNVLGIFNFSHSWTTLGLHRSD